MMGLCLKLFSLVAIAFILLAIIPFQYRLVDGSPASTTTTISTATSNASTASTAGAPPAKTAAATLKILQGASVQGNPSYDPDSLTVKVGDTIAVDNEDSTPHTVTNGKDATDPNMGKLFDTSIINAGDSAEIVTADLQPGEYPFFCSVHPYMTGTLDVQGGVSEQMSGQSPLDQSTKREQAEIPAQDVLITIPSGASSPGNPHYEPEDIEVPLNENIVWVNEDTVPHTATSGTGAEDPNSGKIFDTGIINEGEESAPQQFTDVKEGDKIPYYCQVHPYMSSTLTVGAANASLPVTTLSPIVRHINGVSDKVDPDLIRELLSDTIDNLQNNYTERALVYMDIVRQQLLPQSNISSTFRLILSLVDDASEALQRGDSNTALADLDIVDERLISLTNNTQTTSAENKTTTIGRTD